MDSNALLALRLAFLAILYLFLFLVARAAWHGLRVSGAGVSEPPVTELCIIDPARSRWRRGERIRIYPGDTLGREPGNAVIIDEDTVSARHARFGFERGRWWVEDLGSTNGTFVNRQPLSGQRVLRKGDEVQFGRVAMRFGEAEDSRTR